MTDWVGIAFAAVFLALGAVALFRRREIRYRSFVAGMLFLFAVAALARERITELVVSYKEIRVGLSQLETRVDQISEALETLVVAQQITALQPDNSILLDYDPVPQSVRIIAGPLVNFPRPNYGYELDGRRIRIVHPDTLERIKGRLPGGVTVEYLRRVDSAALR